MNYLLIAITAYLLNAVSVTIDKILLVKRLPNPALYVFYISVFSLVVLVLAPITPFPNFGAFLIASMSSLLWTLGAYFMFKALKTGEASRVIPVIGSLIPVILLLMSAISGNINLNEIWATIILLIGLMFLIFPLLWGKYSKEELLLELVSGLFFANSYFLLKIAYEASNFLSIFVYSRLILLPIILTILIFPILRKKVLFGHGRQKTNLYSKTGVLLFIGQAAGGTSQMMLTFAISLANPAIINSIQGIQYIFIFILSLSLAKKFPQVFNEKINKLNLAGKLIGIILIFLGLWILAFSYQPIKKNLGVTFSPRYAQELGLDPDEVFAAILNDLKPTIVRMPVYWEEIEKEKGKYNFSEVDKYLKQLESKKIAVVLVVGFKQPRWPECFIPAWSKNETPEEFNKSLLNLIKSEISYFGKYQNIKYWQLENEPFLHFGICPKPNYKLTVQELELVKSLDSRPVIITDSGELSSWYQVLKIADVFGTTVYRKVWSPGYGSFSYPWPPTFYSIKSAVVKFFAGSLDKKVLISELQAEPWPPERKSLKELEVRELRRLFSPKQLEENIEYASQTGFDPIIVWGVEWWYFMKVNDSPDYWQIAKMMLSDPEIPTRF